MEEIVKFLKEAETYYLATVEGDQPRVRPFSTAHIFEGKLYIQTGKKKDVSKQLHANPKAELCAFKGGCVLSTRIPKNQKENSLFSEAEFPSFGRTLLVV